MDWNFGRGSQGHVGSPFVEISTTSRLRNWSCIQQAAGSHRRISVSWGEGGRPSRSCWKVGSGLSRSGVKGNGRGEFLRQERPLQALSGWLGGQCASYRVQKGHFLSYLVSWEGRHSTGRPSTGSWMLWTSLWALAVTTV